MNNSRNKSYFLTILLLLCLILPLAANARPAKSKVKNAYIAQIKKMSQSYNTFRTYFLLDLTGDGIPELFVRTGTCEADAQLHIYTYTTSLKRVASIGASHSSFYQGNGYFVLMSGHMGSWCIYKYYLKNGKLMKKRMGGGELKETDDDYPEPKEIGVYEVSFDDLSLIRSM